MDDIESKVQNSSLDDGNRKAQRRKTHTGSFIQPSTHPGEKSHSNKSVPSLSSCRKYIRHYIDSLQLPPGLFAAVMECYEAIDSRKWLIENSASMNIQDAHAMMVGFKLEYIASVEFLGSGYVTRWQEFSQTFDFHVKMSARCWIPTEFWLVNDSGEGAGSQRFSVACGNKKDLSEEREMAYKIIKRATLEEKRNTLASQLRRIEKRIAKEALELTANNKHVVLMLCTDGDELGRKGSAAQDFVDSVVALSKLPVKIIVRLYTDDDRIIDFFNRLDSKLTDIEVLDDYFGEAMEVYLHNPWLTYGLGLHRLREAGLTSDFVGELDERCFSIEDIHRFCEEFFTGGEVDLPHPNNWDAFISSLATILSNEKQQWNPIKRRQTAWIDIKKLEKMFGRRRRMRHSMSNSSFQYSGAGVGRRESLSSITSSADSNNDAMTLEQVIQRWSHQPPKYKKLNSMQDLLVNMPMLFPPTNHAVEAHEYFQKWKCLSREAFTGEGEELNSLLKRAARRSKLFLHPDKLPKDLTKSQTILFQAIWDVVQEQEMKTLG
eukprot:scaffold20854_cov126-Skeletonema_dohrnii-CCMP3373.AAC.4